MSESQEANTSGKDVIYWSEKVEDHTLAVLENDLEDKYDIDFSNFDGTTGVAEINTEQYVTDFDEELQFEGGQLEVEVDREGGLNTIEYWSNDPEIMREFKEFLEAKIQSVEQQPMLEPYNFEDVRSDEISELIDVFQEEFDLEGPLPRKGNGQPRIHLQRVTDLTDEKEHKHSPDEDLSLSSEHEIPGDAKYLIKGAEPDLGSYEELDGKLTIQPQKHDLGKYTVKLYSDDAESMARIVNTSLEAIDPSKEEIGF